MRPMPEKAKVRASFTAHLPWHLREPVSEQAASRPLNGAACTSYARHLPDHNAARRMPGRSECGHVFSPFQAGRTME